ncbi:MAG: HAD-IB family phosphatase [Chlamydiae bacterium]|nr:HAD-IB family phosphatase [Chlamydiota bacterium]
MHLTIFDFDNTLLKVNSSFRYYLFLYNKKVFSLFSLFPLTFLYIRYRFFNLPASKLHEKVFALLLKGQDFFKISKYADLFWEKKISKFFYLPAVLKLQSAIKDGHYIVLMSNSADFLVEPVFKMLKINEYKASSYLLDKNNKISQIKIMMDGEEKKRQALALSKKLNIGSEEITVYSDSACDLPLLEISKHPVAVHPSYRLNKIAKKRGWEVI